VIRVIRVTVFAILMVKLNRKRRSTKQIRSKYREKATCDSELLSDHIKSNPDKANEQMRVNNAPFAFIEANSFGFVLLGLNPALDILRKVRR